MAAALAALDLQAEHPGVALACVVDRANPDPRQVSGQHQAAFKLALLRRFAQQRRQHGRDRAALQAQQHHAIDPAKIEPDMQHPADHRLLGHFAAGKDIAMVARHAGDRPQQLAHRIRIEHVPDIGGDLGHQFGLIQPIGTIDADRAHLDRRGGGGLAGLGGARQVQPVRRIRARGAVARALARHQRRIDMCAHALRSGQGRRNQGQQARTAKGRSQDHAAIRSPIAASTGKTSRIGCHRPALAQAAG